MGIENCFSSLIQIKISTLHTTDLAYLGILTGFRRPKIRLTRCVTILRSWHISFLRQNVDIFGPISVRHIFSLPLSQYLAVSLSIPPFHHIPLCVCVCVCVGVWSITLVLLCLHFHPARPQILTLCVCVCVCVCVCMHVCLCLRMGRHTYFTSLPLTTKIFDLMVLPRICIGVIHEQCNTTVFMSLAACNLNTYMLRIFMQSLSL